MKSLLRWKRLLPLACAVGLLGFTFAASAELPGLTRERGALYLEDFLDQPYRVRVLQPAAVYYSSDLARLLGMFRPGQLVEIQAVDDKRGLLRVRGQAQQGQVAGWMEARFLTPLDPAFISGLKRTAERKTQIRTLTANGEIAMGMTMDEVTASLGQPVRKSAHTDATGSVETWEYLRYVTVPRTVTSYDGFGRGYSGVAYVRVPAGKFSASFRDGVVSAIDRSQVEVANPGVVVPTRNVTSPVTPTTPTGFAERDISG